MQSGLAPRPACSLPCAIRCPGHRFFSLYACATCIRSYFSVMTITSVGYGDISPTPLNEVEQLVGAALLLVSSVIWAQLVTLDGQTLFRL